MRKLYEKSEITFALMWIIIYTLGNSIANSLSASIGVEKSAHAIFSIALTLILFIWIKKNGLMHKYGLCKSPVPARKFLWYIPLAVITSQNLWNGAAVNFPWLGMVCYIAFMLCVGFLEEIIFRGFLFKAMEKDNLKTAIIVSSVTFGLGHLLHLINGSGAGLVENLCQVVGAIAIGFLFVIVFYRGGSLIPCIATHSAIDAVSAFANEAGLTQDIRILLCVIRIVIAVVYSLILLRTLPKPQSAAEASA